MTAPRLAAGGGAIIHDRHWIEHDCPRDAHGDPVVLQHTDLELLATLWRTRFLSATMIGRWIWPGRSERKRRARLQRLAEARLIGRYRPRLERGNGSHEYIYHLTRSGFRLAQRAYGPDGRAIPTDAKFTDAPAITHHNGPQHDLRLAEWLLAYREAAGERWIDWNGQDASRIDVPTRYRAGQRTPLELADLALPEPQRVDGIDEPLLPLQPDAAIELHLPDRDAALHVLVEFDRTGRASKNVDKLTRADALITAWWRAVPGYRALGAPPVVVFVCPDDRAMHSLMRAADQVVIGHLATPGYAETWPHPGRLRMRFCNENELLNACPRAFRVPDRPPADRPSGTLEFREGRLPSVST